MSPTETRQRVQTCPDCGSVVDEHALACPFCQAMLGQESHATQNSPEESPAVETLLNEEVGSPLANSSERPSWPARPGGQAETQPPVPEPEWRREVAHRLESYRARKEPAAPGTRRHVDDSQSHLSFSQDADGGTAGEIDPSASLRVIDRGSPEYRATLRRDRHADPAAVNHVEAQARPEKIEIVAVEPPSEFSEPEEESWHPDREVERLVPVAGLDERWHAALYDATCLALAFGVFLVLFRTLGGRLSLARPDAAVSAAVFALLYALYFALFTGLGGATPGLDARGLCIVSFDGTAPSRAQLAWRSFGYLVSAGTLLLGFLWALWDEDGLTWHDRISQTYVTSGSPVSVQVASEDAAARAGSPT